MIGLTVNGDVVLANQGAGILLDTTSSATIGGTTAAARNVISANDSGIQITGVGSGNVIEGDYIGTDATGTIDFGNAHEGVSITSGDGDVVGGSVAGAGNVISGNAVGVVIAGAGANPNIVQGNFIGTDATGTAPLGNAAEGVLI